MPIALRSSARPAAQDQVALAARAALLIKKRWPEATVAVATGRGTAHRTTGVGEVADRAVQIVQRWLGRSTEGLSSAQSGIWLDELSVRLLSSNFTVLKLPEGALLTGEEKEIDESRRLLGKATACVGRDEELSILDVKLTSCIEESEARVTLITAPPGMGKSRLRHEFIRRVEKRTDQLTTLLGRGDMTNAGAPYGILGAAIRRSC